MACSSSSDSEHQRTIRSFVKREGRMTPAQQRALDELMPLYGLDTGSGQIDLDRVFPRHAARYLEIGFGMGDSLVQMASEHPQHDYIGIEVHRPGVGRTLQQIERQQLTNLRLINHDAVEVLRDNIPDNSLDGIYLFFPDPWHKKKHHKRRIVQRAFVEQVHSKLKPGGLYHMATDWQDYAEHMRQVMEGINGFERVHFDNAEAARGDRPLTKYELRGQRLGHHVSDVVYRRR